ncbi:hypothetical protein M1146_06625, partial [Patescibacteria group bacterium]|nr:hypothetical protein [Patescibacteria group bacterium]
QILLTPIIWCLTRSPETGAQVILHCCLDDRVQGGKYYSNCQEKPTTGKENISNDENSWKRLWELSEESVKEFLSDNKN